MADVANTWPLDPTPSTMIEAMTTIKSVKRERQFLCFCLTLNKIRVAITSVSMKLCTYVKPYIA